MEENNVKGQYACLTW